MPAHPVPLEHHVFPREPQQPPAVGDQLVVAPAVPGEVGAAAVMGEAVRLDHDAPLGVPEVDVDHRTRGPDLQLGHEPGRAGVEDDAPQARFERVVGATVGMPGHSQTPCPAGPPSRLGAGEQLPAVDEAQAQCPVGDGQRLGERQQRRAVQDRPQDRVTGPSRSVRFVRCRRTAALDGSSGPVRDRHVHLRRLQHEAQTPPGRGARVRQHPVRPRGGLLGRGQAGQGVGAAGGPDDRPVGDRPSNAGDGWCARGGPPSSPARRGGSAPRRGPWGDHASRLEPPPRGCGPCNAGCGRRPGVDDASAQPQEQQKSTTHRLPTGCRPVVMSCGRSCGAARAAAGAAWWCQVVRSGSCSSAPRPSSGRRAGGSP